MSATTLHRLLWHVWHLSIASYYGNCGKFDICYCLTSTPHNLTSTMAPMATVYGNLLWQPWQTLSLLPPYIYCPSPQPYSTMAFMATVYGILQWQLWQSEIFYCLTSTAQVHSLTSSMAPMALVYGNLRWQLWQLDICYSLTSTTQVYILTSATRQESSNNSYYGT